MQASKKHSFLRRSPLAYVVVPLAFVLVSTALVFIVGHTVNFHFLFSIEIILHAYSRKRIDRESLPVFTEIEDIMKVYIYIQSRHFIFRKEKCEIRRNPKIVSYHITSLCLQTEPFIIGLISKTSHQRTFSLFCLGIHS